MTENQSQTAPFEAWGLLELFGHTRLAGKLSEQSVGGVHFIRIDIPEVEGQPEHTRFFTQGAIYGMTVLAEATARQLAGYLKARPVSAYEVMCMKEPSQARLAFDEDDGDDELGF